MATLWEVIGGGDAGGIVVRTGKDTKSAATTDRLGKGSVVEQIALEGERLNYKLVKGSGPETGWVSLKIKAANLLVPKAAEPEEALGPGEGTTVEVDKDLKAKIEANAKVKKDEGALEKWIPKYKVLGGPIAGVKFRIICFHNAGSAESIYTAKTTPFYKWATETKAVEVCAFDHPGRDKLLKVDKITECSKMAEEFVSVFYEKLSDGVPYIVWGHSVGTWVGFEFLTLVRKIGLPSPVAAFLMGFPAPHMPEGRRTWHKNAKMNDKQFREELKSWDRKHFEGMGAPVFDEAQWPLTYEPMIRADFTLFDSYAFNHNGMPKFTFPIHAWHFSEENYNSAEQIEMWKEWTTGAFDFQVMKGMGHLTCCYIPEQKDEYFGKVTEAMKKYTGLQ